MKNLLRLCLLLLCCLASLPAVADQLPLPADQAFVFNAKIGDNQTLLLNWHITPGYYLYRDRFSFELTAPANAKIGSVQLPAGIAKQDDILGNYQIYEGDVTIPVVIKNAQGQPITLTMHYQGCSEYGFCYPPIKKTIRMALVQTQTVPVPTTTIVKPAAVPVIKVTKQLTPFTELLASHHYAAIVFSFICFGLLLSFTPCVLPMVPILASIIVGQRQTITTLKAFTLSLTYVLSMAITYAVLGLLAGLAGSYVQAAMQNPWVIGIFCTLFVLLALSMFDCYELRLPSRMQEGIMNASNRQQGGTYIGVAIMGCLATLILSPCVSAPLVGVLAYISQTGNATLGGLSLFAMGIGMGIPLLFIGTTGGAYLPKAGPWMQAIKATFGFILLGLAVYLLARIIPGPVALALWGILLFFAGLYLGALECAPKADWQRFWKGIGLLSVLYGTVLLFGALQSNADPLQPLTWRSVNTTPSSSSVTVAIQRVKGLANLQNALQQAVAQHKSVMVDFYADWCADCKEMERSTFSDPQVQSALKDVVWLQADITANDADDTALEQYFNVTAPPTILFFNNRGQEIATQRIYGAKNATDFLRILQEVIPQMQTIDVN